VKSTLEDRGRGFVKGSIRLLRMPCARWNKPPLARRLLGLRDSDLWRVTAEVVGLLRPQNGCNRPGQRRDPNVSRFGQTVSRFAAARHTGLSGEDRARFASMLSD
jgi:hypothetical protein